jgi:hypothetical protein
MSLFTLGSTRAVLVVALAYSFPDVFNVIMALHVPPDEKTCGQISIYKEFSG